MCTDAECKGSGKRDLKSSSRGYIQDMEESLGTLNRQNADRYIDQIARHYITLSSIPLALSVLPLLLLCGLAAYCFINSVTSPSEIVTRTFVALAMAFLLFTVACFGNLNSWRKWRKSVKTAISRGPSEGFFCEFRKEGSNTYADISSPAQPDVVIYSKKVLSEIYDHLPTGQKMEAAIFFAQEGRGAQSSAALAIEINHNLVLLSPPGASLFALFEASPEFLQSVNRS